MGMRQRPRIAAQANVAAMADFELFGDRAVLDDPCQSMGTDHPPVEDELAVACLVG